MKLHGDVVWGEGWLWLWYGEWKGSARVREEKGVERGPKSRERKGVSGVRTREAVRYVCGKCTIPSLRLLTGCSCTTAKKHETLAVSSPV